MTSATSCFQEDAACVIISEGAWRLYSPMESEIPIEGGGTKGSSITQLLFFLGRALALTRRTLYVLLCVDLHGSYASHARPAAAQGTAGCDELCDDVGEFVSCGPEAWHFCVWLSANLGDVARRLDLAVSPLVLPWGTEQYSAEEKPTKGTDLDRRDWVARARAAIIRHYRLTLTGSPWLSQDEAALACAVPLVLDPFCAFTDRDICDRWPRHYHLSPLHVVRPTSQLQFAQICRMDESGSCIIPDSQVNLRMGRDAAEGKGIARMGTSFKYTVVAGTFDRLHSGHRLLLAAALLATNETTGLAVASGPLVQKKTTSDQEIAAMDIEPFAYRLQVAVAFLQLLAAARGRELYVSGLNQALLEEDGSLSGEQRHHAIGFRDPNALHDGVEPLLPGSIPANALHSSRSYLRLQVFRITDAVGPADRLAFDCLVVSQETLRGGYAVNSIRRKLGNDSVSLLAVQLIPQIARTAQYIAGALEASLPFLKSKQRDESEVNPSFDTKKRVHDASTAPAKPAKHTATSSNNETVHSDALREAPASSAVAVQDNLMTKVSSTELRSRQWRRLHCGSISWLCARFRSAWLWLMGSTGELQTFAMQSAVAFWHVLCGEHAAPWRRLHTFERVARALQRLNDTHSFVKAEPVVLCVFLGSLLACPCRCITVTTRPCDALDCCSSNDTAASWTPNTEGEAWQRTAKSLLADLQSKVPEDPSNEQSTKVSQTQREIGELVAGSGSLVPDKPLLKGPYSLLMALLCEQRGASLATLATPPQAFYQKQELTCLHTNGSTTTTEQDVAELVRLVRRLEQLECTEDSVTFISRVRNLREEYFFVEDADFAGCRTSQLVRVLNNAEGFDSLGPQELLCATANVRQELKRLGRAASMMVEEAASSV